MLAESTIGPLHFHPSHLQDEKAKDDFANASRLICIVYEVSAVVMVLESWMKMAKPGESLNPDELPSESLDRQEVVVLMGEAEGRLDIPGSAEISHELADELYPGLALHDRLRRLVEIERDNARLVQLSKAKDDKRGARIIPGYAAAHTAAPEDAVVKSAWERVAMTEERVRALGVVL